jgi:catechol 2,3-dioxygenase-like lactoylglutathione lyase family enzyme
MRLVGLDHLVLTVRDLERTVDFYQGALGMTVSSFEGGRLALKFGSQKINLHQSGAEYSPHASQPIPGSADLCFVTDRPLAEWLDHFADLDIPVVEGPGPRTGALGPMTSIYVQDPDLNLIEIASYDPA